MKKPTVLVIDDDEIVRTALTSVLAERGYDVTGAGNGAEGLSLFSQRPADVVVTDIFMPEIEGIEVIRELRRNFPDVRIIAISGGGPSERMKYLHVARELGANRTLRKPFSLVELVREVREVLEDGATPPARFHVAG